ncbi:MAG: hypothetical protein KC503_33870 [Myxococcales bacterium]|nr:hypothetical protein [Myxococcales bacterium]
MFRMGDRGRFRCWITALCWMALFGGCDSTTLVIHWQLTGAAAFMGADTLEVVLDAPAGFAATSEGSPVSSADVDDDGVTELRLTRPIGGDGPASLTLLAGEDGAYFDPFTLRARGLLEGFALYGGEITRVRFLRGELTEVTVPLAQIKLPKPPITPEPGATLICDGGPKGGFGRSTSGTRELHIVDVNESRTATVEVDVKRDREVVLVLNSYDPVDWKVSGAKVVAVYHDAFAGTSRVTAPAGVEVKTLDLSSGVEDDNAPYQYQRIRRIEEGTELDVTSYRFCYAIQQVTIDGGSGLDALPAPEAVAAPGERRYAQWTTIAGDSRVPPTFQPSKPDVSADGREVTYPAGGDGAVGAISDVSLSSGRWYWELTIGTLGSSAVFERLVGFAPAYIGPDNFIDGWHTERMMCGLIPQGQMACGFERSTSPAFKEGDVIGIALDIDGRQVYAHLNGAWQIADPAQDKGTPVLLPSIPVPLTPMVSLSRGDSIRANFGSAPFAYPQMVPPGYAPGWFTKQTSP